MIEEKKSRKGLAQPAARGLVKEPTEQKYILIYRNEFGLERHSIFDYKQDVMEFLAANPLISGQIVFRGWAFEVEYEKIISII